MLSSVFSHWKSSSNQTFMTLSSHVTTQFYVDYFIRHFGSRIPSNQLGNNGFSVAGTHFIKIAAPFSLSLGFQTPCEEVFGPQKHTQKTFWAGIWKTRVCISTIQTLRGPAIPAPRFWRSRDFSNGRSPDESVVSMNHQKFQVPKKCWNPEPYKAILGGGFSLTWLLFQGNSHHKKK